MTTAISSSLPVTDPLEIYRTKQAEQLAQSNAETSSKTEKSVTGLSGNFDTFIKILLTQLKYQDPLDAVDTNQFTQQLVQYSGVEQQINTNQKLDSLIQASGSGTLNSLLGFVGKKVEAASPNGIVALQQGTASLAYTLPTSVESLEIRIADATGNVVSTLTAPKQAGTHIATWDGKGASGAQLADGSYKATIVAKDKTGQIIKAPNIRLIGSVSSVETDSKGTGTVNVGSVSVRQADITRVLA